MNFIQEIIWQSVAIKTIHAFLLFGRKKLFLCQLTRDDGAMKEGKQI